MTRNNARFYVYVNGCNAKLTLRPGQSIAWESAGPTDEGWRREAVRWTHEGDYVRREWMHEGQDCDGRSGNYGADVCPLEDLHAGNEPYLTGDDDPAAWEGVIWPAWERSEESAYDQFAELAGY